MLNEKEVETNPVRNRVFVAKDSKKREELAMKKHEKFFSDKEHVLKVELVKNIVESFFKVTNGLYVNSRPNRDKPFTSIKVANPIFPNDTTQSYRKKYYYDPLKALGVEIVYAKGTDSWIYRVR